MPSNLKTRLRGPSGSKSNGWIEAHVAHAPTARQRGQKHRSGTQAKNEVETGLGRGKSTLQPSMALRRRFLLQLAIALHSHGSSASRTEYLIDKAADRLDVETNIAVFPSLILLSFPGVGERDSSRDSSKQKKDKRMSHKNHHISYESRKEMHMLTVGGDLDVGKLERVDELANRVGKEGTPFMFAYWRLKTILDSPPVFDKRWRILGFALSAAAAAPLFFDGSPLDAFFSLLLGSVVGVLDLIASDFSILGTILEFSSAVVVSFSARCLSVRLKDLGLCYIAITLGALTQLLPGMALTLGASEMIAKSRVTGSASIMYGLYSSMQLGFGLSTGENLVWWAGEPSPVMCDPSKLPVWCNLIWYLFTFRFVGYAIGSNILLRARLEQWPGMTLAAFVGYVVSYMTDPRFPSSASSAVSAFAVGIAGIAYSYVTGELPLVMVISGINLLVPGGIGVQGVAAMLNDDVSSGVGFVFEMVVVALSLTIGLLVAKLAMPAALQTNRPINFHKANLSTLMIDAEQDSESSTRESDSEDMAL